MNSFVTTYDYDNSQMSFGIRNDATGVKINDDNNKGLSGGEIAGIIIGSVAILVMFAILVFCCIKKRKEDKLNAETTYSKVKQTLQ